MIRNGLAGKSALLCMAITPNNRDSQGNDDQPVDYKIQHSQVCVFSVPKFCQLI